MLFFFCFCFFCINIQAPPAAAQEIAIAPSLKHVHLGKDNAVYYIPVHEEGQRNHYEQPAGKQQTPPKNTADKKEPHDTYLIPPPVCKRPRDTAKSPESPVGSQQNRNNSTPTQLSPQDQMDVCNALGATKAPREDMPVETVHTTIYITKTLEPSEANCAEYQSRAMPTQPTTTTTPTQVSETEPTKNEERNVAVASTQYQPLQQPNSIPRNVPCFQPPQNSAILPYQNNYGSPGVGHSPCNTTMPNFFSPLYSPTIPSVGIPYFANRSMSQPRSCAYPYGGNRAYGYNEFLEEYEETPRKHKKLPRYRYRPRISTQSSVYRKHKSARPCVSRPSVQTDPAVIKQLDNRLAMLEERLKQKLDSIFQEAEKEKQKKKDMLLLEEEREIHKTIEKLKNEHKNILNNKAQIQNTRPVDMCCLMKKIDNRFVEFEKKMRDMVDEKKVSPRSGNEQEDIPSVCSNTKKQKNTKTENSPPETPTKQNNKHASEDTKQNKTDTKNNKLPASQSSTQPKIQKNNSTATGTSGKKQNNSKTANAQGNKQKNNDEQKLEDDPLVKYMGTGSTKKASQKKPEKKPTQKKPPAKKDENDGFNTPFMGVADDYY